MKLPSLKLIQRIIVILCLVLLLIAVGLSLYIQLYGKELLTTALTNSLQRKVTIADLYYEPPLGLHGYDLAVENIGKTRELKVQFNLDAIFHRKIKVASLVLADPQVLLKQTDITHLQGFLKNDGEESSGRSPVTTSTEGAVQVETTKSTHASGPMQVEIGKLSVRDGQLIYMNDTSDSPYSLVLNKIQLGLRNIVYPLKSSPTKFKFEAYLASSPWPLTGSRIEGQGWMNIVRRDLEGKVRFIDQHQVPIVSADLLSKNNDMSVRGDVKLNHLFFSAFSKQGKEPSALNDLVSSTFSSTGIDVGAKFAFKTRMDDFKVDNISFSGNVIAGNVPDSQGH